MSGVDAESSQPDPALRHDLRLCLPQRGRFNLGASAIDGRPTAGPATADVNRPEGLSRAKLPVPPSIRDLANHRVRFRCRRGVSRRRGGGPAESSPTETLRRRCLRDRDRSVVDVLDRLRRHALDIDGSRWRRAFVGLGFSAASGSDLRRGRHMASGPLETVERALHDVGAEAIGRLPEVAEPRRAVPGLRLAGRVGLPVGRRRHLRAFAGATTSCRCGRRLEFVFFQPV